MDETVVRATRGTRNGAGSSASSLSSSSSLSSTVSTTATIVETKTAEIKGVKKEAGDWVQCDACAKWRLLPSTVDVSSLPDIWTCSLNIYDPALASCDAQEESYKESPEPKLVHFLQLWTKKLKDGDRAEGKLLHSAVTRQRKRRLESEWIKCCNPSCGKWRTVLRGLDVSLNLKKLNKSTRWGQKSSGFLWYCSMNSWDQTVASCSAPQEPLHDVKWNL